MSADSPAARAAHILHERPTDPGLVLDLLTAAVARVAPEAPGPQALVVVPDADAALAVADLARELEHGTRLVPITSVKRAARLLPGGPAVVVGGLTDLVECLRRSLLKVEHVQQVVVLETERLDTEADLAALDALLAELPKDATRVLVAATVSDAVRDLTERHLFRARRLSAPTPAAAALATVQVLVATPGARSTALAHLLDDIDPPSVTIIAERARDREAAETALARLGLARPLATVVAAAGPVPEHVALAVCWGVPSAKALASIASAQPTRVIAMVGPRDRRALAHVTAGAELPPYVPSDAARSVRAAGARLRASLRDELARGIPLRELAALEPLFEQHEPADIAAAAVRLLDVARARLAAALAAPPVAVPVVAAAPRAAEPEGDRGRGGARERGTRDRDRGREAPRGDARWPKREGGAGKPFKKPGRGAPMRDGPKGFGKGRPARGPEEGGPRKEWQERGERMKHAKRRRDD